MMNCSVTILTISHKILEPHFPLIRSLHAFNQSHCLHVLRSEIGGHAYVSKIKKSLMFFHHHHSSMILLIDAFDVYFRCSLDLLLRRFQILQKQIAISSELSFTHQDLSWKPYFEHISNLEHRFLNSGLIMGRGDHLSKFFVQVSQSPFLIVQNKRGADQAAMSHVIFRDGFEYYDAVLDYNQTLFYTAGLKRWSLSLSNKEIKQYDPCIVHFPFIAAPRINKTYFASYDHHIGLPWPESNTSFCKHQEHECAKMKTTSFCHIGPGHRPGLNRLVC